MQTLRQFEEARASLASALIDSEELERRAHEAGVNLVRAEDQLRLMQRQNNDLTMRRKDSERMLSEIEAVNNNNIIIIIPLLYIVLFS